MSPESNNSASFVLGDAPGAARKAGAAPPPRITLKEDDVRNGLGKLVLTVVELVRELVERQAIRRMESGSLTEDEVERLGATLMQLEEEVKRLKKIFGIENEELNIDLGPLGKLL